MHKCEGCGTETVHADDCPALGAPNQPLPCLRTQPHPPHKYMLNRTSRPCPGVPEPDLYFCPTTGEIESGKHGGFSVCCAHPDRHVPIERETPAITAIAAYLSEKAERDFKGGPWAETIDTTDGGRTLRIPAYDKDGGETGGIYVGGANVRILHSMIGGYLFNTTDPDLLGKGVLEYVTQAVARFDMDHMMSPEQPLPDPDHDFWRLWRASARNAIMAYNVYSEQHSGHRYLSTGCLHGEHGYCQSNTGSQGQKTPAVCKFCSSPCVCSCHLPGEVTVVERIVNPSALKPVADLTTEYCYAAPPGGAGAQWTGPNNTSGNWGDCDCTKPLGHEGDHACEPCIERSGAPSWPQEPEEDSDDENLREHGEHTTQQYEERMRAPLSETALTELRRRMEQGTLPRRRVSRRTEIDEEN